MSKCRLIYRSTAVGAPLDTSAIESLAANSARRNAERNITGMLLVTGDRFLQVLEGPVRAVNQLYGRIVTDERHQQVTLLSYEQLGSVYFPDWGMLPLDLYNLPLEPRRLLMAKYDHHDGEIRIPDRLHEVYALLLDARAIARTQDDAVAVPAEFQAQPSIN